MIRKSLLALAAVAALGLTAASTTDALAKKGGGGFKGGGWHHHHNHHGFRRGFRVGFYAPYQECVKVITRRGNVKVICTY
jgi:hypothetical protein